jgi:hypothetical protein
VLFIIALTLNMAALTPIGFDPDLVFNRLYRGRCLEGWRTLEDDDEHQHCNAVFEHFTQYFRSIGLTRSSATIRKDILRSYYLQWNGLSLITTCFYCLCRPPEHILACRHTICDTYVVVFGSLNKCAEYHFDIIKCLLCYKSSPLTFR